MDADCQATASTSTVPAGSHDDTNDDHDCNDLLNVHDDPPMEEGMLENVIIKDLLISMLFI